MSELPHDPIDKLIQRAHNERIGAPPSFKGRLRARMAAEATVQKHTRMQYIKLAVSAAAVLILALVIGLNVDLFLPNKTTPPPPQAKDETPEPANKPVLSTPKDNTQPEPRPEPKPEPQPEPTPESKPDDTIERPEPKPEPQPEPRPDDKVGKPEPEPEPRPERTAGDAVNKPESDQPDGTAPRTNPESRIEVATLLNTDARLEVRYGEQDWRKPDPDEVFYAGVQFKAGRSPVDIRLLEGAYARFDGELSLTWARDTYMFALTDDSLYVDNLALGTPIRVVANDFTADMSDGAGLFHAARNGLEAACIAGEIRLAGTIVEVKTTRKVTNRGVGDAKDWKGDRFLRDMPGRPLLREDFDSPPPGGLYNEGERLENGVAVMEKAPRYIAFRYNPTLQVLPGMMLRVRYRTTNVSNLELELFEQQEVRLLEKTPQVMFKHKWAPAKNGEWLELELRIEEIADNADAEHFPQHGDLLRNFKLHFTGDKLEIDWVEFVRTQD